MFLLEDNPADVRLFREAIAELKLPMDLDVATSFEAAGKRVREMVAGGVPDLAILDVHLPTGSGIEILQQIRAQPELSDLNVLMLTTSDRDGDLQEAQVGGATSYYIKPVDLEGTLELVQEIQTFWLDRQSQA